MKTVTMGLSDHSQVKERFKAAMAGQRIGNFISFANPGLMFKTMTLKRWDILEALTGKDPDSIREIARLVGRDVKAGHTDVTALLNVGILDKGDKFYCLFTTRLPSNKSLSTSIELII